MTNTKDKYKHSKRILGRYTIWNGVSTDGRHVSMGHSVMLDYASVYGGIHLVMFGHQIEISESESLHPRLRGAKMVRLRLDEKNFEEAAIRAGWDDLAEVFRKHGI